MTIQVTQDAATSTPLMHLTTTRPKAPKRKKPRKFCAFDEDDVSKSMLNLATLMYCIH